jgi:hypothetical protein
MEVRKSTSADPKIPVRPGTREKFDRVARETRLKLVDIADLAIDAYVASQQKPRRRKPATPAA